jgi:hypothetical protein
VPEIRTSRPSTHRSPKCGSEYPALGRFCVDCRVAPQAVSPSCPSCGGSIPEGAQFCPGSGAALSGGGAVVAASAAPALAAAPVTGESKGRGKLGTYLFI